MISTGLEKSSNFPRKSWNHLQLLTWVLGCLIFGDPALAQERQIRTLTVTGQGVENVQATIAEVRLGVEVQGKTAKEVQQALRERSSALVAFLKSRKVERLTTTGVNLNSTYRDSNGKQQLVGYIGSNTVSFRTSPEQAGALLDAAVQAGATRIEGVSFTAADQALVAAQQQALREAVQDAQAQASTVLDSLKLAQREIVSIQINGAIPPVPVEAQADRAVLARSAAPTPIVGGEQEVQAFVTLQIGY